MEIIKEAKPLECRGRFRSDIIAGPSGLDYCIKSGSIDLPIYVSSIGSINYEVKYYIAKMRMKITTSLPHSK